MDYCFPNWMAKALRKPSLRVQLESSMIGTLFIMITGVGTAIYVIFFSDLVLWYKILSGIGGVGIFLMLGSQLVTTYVQYYSLKLSMGLYQTDERLIQKIDEAKDLVNDLNKLIEENSNEVENNTENLINGVNNE